VNSGLEIDNDPMFRPIFLLVTLALFWATSASAQRTNRRTPAPQRPTIDYSKFSHSTKKHQDACNACHKVPTANWKQLRLFPDVSDYPDHSACVSCHRNQFFRSARPVICSVCHVRTSPRDDARLEFRNLNRQLQFTIEFPHDKHQDVIARTLRRDSLVRANHVFAADEKPYNNCTICHAPRTTPPKSPSTGWLDGYSPDQLTFKSAPADHSSCFNCHWKAQQPVSSNCNGCHKLATPFTRTDLPLRISMKFKHDGGGEKKNHVAECTTCHINITRVAMIRGLKPDVPITSCTECHNRDGLRQDLNKELVAIDKNKEFVCSYCHTSNVGRKDAPASHYLIAERPALKRSDIK
jgi:hypothetical protein